MEQFGIQIEDGSVTLPRYAVEQNKSSLELYDWQRNAINYFFKTNKAIFEVTTGAGKTYCAIEIIKRVFETDPDVQVLIVVPKNVILEDTWHRELYNAGITLRDIGLFYGGIKEYSKITITNMQNLNRIALPLFDMVIFDEIHNYGTTRLLPYVRYPFKYKLGLSATLERMDDAHWKIAEIFDYNVFKYTPQEALRDNILDPFDFVNITVNLDDEAREQYEELTRNLNVLLRAGGGFKRIMRSGSGLKFKMLSVMNKRKDLVNNYYRKFDVVKQIVEKHRKDKIIVFNEYNQQTNRTYWYLLDLGVNACIVHSGIEKNKRAQNMMDFRSDKFNIMLTSKVLDEGMDIPKLDVAIIAAGNSTSRQTVQRMGRVLRKKDKNSMLYQVYCRGTVEEEYAIERSKLFRSLCSSYKERNYQGEAIVL